MSSVFEFIIRAKDEASAVIEGIGSTGSGVASALSDNWLKIGAGAAGAAAGIEAAARNQQDATVQARELAASVGMSEDAFRQLVTETSNVTFPLDSVLNLMETGKQLGLDSAESLQEYAWFWDTVGDATGENADALGKAGVALAQLGIKAGEEAKALDAFGYITENSTMSIGDFLAFVERAGPEISEMGLDVNDTTALLSAMEKELGMTGRVARQEFRSAVNEADGDLGKLLKQLGLNEEQFNTYRDAIEGSSEVIDRNAGIVAESFTPLQRMQHEMQELIFRHGALIGEAAKLAPALGAIGPAMGAATKAGQALKVAQAGLNVVMAANPIILVVLALVALAAGLVIAYQKSETFREIVNGAFSTVMGVVQPVIDWFAETIPIVFERIVEAGQQVADFLTGVWGTVWPWVSGLISGAGETFNTTFAGIQAVVDTVLPYVQEFVTNWLNNLKAIWDALWPPFRELIELVWGAIRTVVETYLSIVFTVISTYLSVLKSLWDTLWPPFRTLVDTVWGAIKTVIDTVFGAVRDFIAATLDAIKRTWETVWGALEPIVRPVFEAVRGFVETVMGIIRGIIESVLGAIQGHWETVWGAVRGIAETIWGLIQGVVQTYMDLVADIVFGRMDEIKERWDRVWGAIRDFLTGIWEGAGSIVSKVEGGVGAVKDTVSDVMGTVESAWESVWGGMRDFLSGIWDEIESRVRGGVNGVISAINGILTGISNLSIEIPGFDTGIPGVPSFGGLTIGFPDIPLLPMLNVGGKILKTGLAVVHEGELVVNPAQAESLGIGMAPGPGKSGPAGIPGSAPGPGKQSPQEIEDNYNEYVESTGGFPGGKTPGNQIVDPQIGDAASTEPVPEVPAAGIPMSGGPGASAAVSAGSSAAWDGSDVLWFADRDGAVHIFRNASANQQGAVAWLTEASKEHGLSFVGYGGGPLGPPTSYKLIDMINRLLTYGDEAPNVLVNSGGTAGAGRGRRVGGGVLGSFGGVTIQNLYVQAPTDAPRDMARALRFALANLRVPAKLQGS